MTQLEITPGWASRFADGRRVAGGARPGQQGCRQGVWVRWQRRPGPSHPPCRRPACFRDGISTLLSSRAAPQPGAMGRTETGWQADTESGRGAGVGALSGGREIPVGPRLRTLPRQGSKPCLTKNLISRVPAAALDPATEFFDETRRIVGFHELLEQFVVGLPRGLDRLQEPAGTRVHRNGRDRIACHHGIINGNYT